jgi:hypothetical protein
LDTKTAGKVLITFLILSMTLAINVGDNVLARLGFDQGYLKVALCAVVVTGLIARRNLLLVVLVLLLSFGANMPADFMLNFGIDRDIFLGALGAIVLMPVLARVMDLDK